MLLFGLTELNNGFSHIESEQKEGKANDNSMHECKKEQVLREEDISEGWGTCMATHSRCSRAMICKSSSILDSIKDSFTGMEKM